MNIFGYLQIEEAMNIHVVLCFFYTHFAYACARVQGIFTCKATDVLQGHRSYQFPLFFFMLLVKHWFQHPYIWRR